MGEEEAGINSLWSKMRITDNGIFQDKIFSLLIMGEERGTLFLVSQKIYKIFQYLK